MPRPPTLPGAHPTFWKKTFGWSGPCGTPLPRERAMFRRRSCLSSEHGQLASHSTFAPFLRCRHPPARRGLPRSDAPGDASQANLLGEGHSDSRILCARNLSRWRPIRPPLARRDQVRCCWLCQCGDSLQKKTRMANSRILRRPPRSMPGHPTESKCEMSRGHGYSPTLSRCARR